MNILKKAAWVIFPACWVLFLSGCLSGGGGGGDDAVTGSAPSGPAPGTCSSVTYIAPSGAANNIVFSFNKPYVCGQFANGDWWVSVDASGFVTITSITPDASGGRNGFEVNPSSINQQAFDNTAEVAYNAGLLPALPLTLAGVSSVVKAVSILAAGRPQLRFAAVLTVVNAPVSNTTEVFRPAYFGATKTFYSTTALRVALLPKYTATTLPSVAGFPISAIATRYRQVQLDHYLDFQGRDMHPADSFTDDYGAQIATDNAVYLLRMLLSDFDYSNPTHKQALVNYLQMAVDLQAMAIGGNSWPANGGHGNGRKLPLVFAAWIFNDTSFSNAIAASQFSEDQEVWRSGVTGQALYGVVDSDFRYWQTTRTGGATGPRDARDPYGYIDGGGYEIGGGYQFCCTAKPWKYTVLALLRLGLVSAWDPADDVLVEYVERWVASGTKALPDPCAPYDGIPANYGITYGPNPATPGQCFLGAGRWPAVDGTSPDGGNYGNAFGDEFWVWHKANP